MTNVHWLVIPSGAFAVLYSIYAGRAVLSADAGSERMREISAAVQEGATATSGALWAAYERWCNDVREPTRLTRPQFREALHEQFTQDSGKTRRVTFLGVGLQSEHQELLDV